MRYAIVLALTIGLFVAAAPGDAPPATTQPEDRPTSQPTTRSAGDERIAMILERMEAMGEKVDDLRCNVEYTVEDLIGLDQFTKFGRILYKRTKPNPVFFIEFEKLHQGGYVNRQHEWYLFKERWLYEAKEASRTVIQREVVHEGETIDLFNIEKTPFPIPFGQRKEQILKNFRVTLREPQTGDPKDTDHLVCEPRPGSRVAENYSRLDFLVSRDLQLPVKIVAVEADPDGEPNKIITAVFPDLSKQSINSGLPPDEFKLPKTTQEYQVIEEPLEEPVAPGAH